ncbi:hypothetical protein PLICRDRAFT_44366 [Plicaturopsis crispa FD-325 SS-3]|nr:hypothetical protein PLICRDRAFT_44366 [Plicaturopsis crispa FD-325 SS-3]
MPHVTPYHPIQSTSSHSLTSPTPTLTQTLTRRVMSAPSLLRVIARRSLAPRSAMAVRAYGKPADAPHPVRAPSFPSFPLVDANTLPTALPLPHEEQTRISRGLPRLRRPRVRPPVRCG